jgi:hypothetical protein
MVGLLYVLASGAASFSDDKIGTFVTRITLSHAAGR